MSDRIRIACFIDGFNLYHAIANLRRPDLKWVNLWKLTEAFLDPAVHDLRAVYYFSAYATWLAGPHARHQQYVEALKAAKVTPIMGRFKEKDIYCKSCKSTFKGHEEKETDVNIALALIREAYRDSYDEAFIISRDSDLIPAMKLLLADYPKKHLKIISPPNAGHSKEMGKLVGSKKLAAIKSIHLERSLFGATVTDPDTGLVVARRPHQYDPPKP